MTIFYKLEAVRYGTEGPAEAIGVVEPIAINGGKASYMPLQRPENGIPRRSVCKTVIFERSRLS